MDDILCNSIGKVVLMIDTIFEALLWIMLMLNVILSIATHDRLERIDHTLWVIVALLLLKL